MGLVAIDFKASCVQQRDSSYPIEVGIAGDDGAFAWLIRPHGSWRGWKWSGQAERLHGITRRQLRDYGQPVEVVARAVRMATMGQRVIADSPFDNYCIRTLFMAAGMGSPPRVEHVSVIFDELNASDDEVTAALIATDLLKAHNHRARHDAVWLLALIEKVAEASCERSNRAGMQVAVSSAKNITIQNVEYDGSRHAAI